MCKDMPPLELAIQFHGHICPGLLMGVRAAEFAREYLNIGRDFDEELVAVVETDSCGVDAIQAILGCTFGKGNLIFRDWGKNVYTIFSREQRRGIRIAQKFRSLRGSEYQRFRQLSSQEKLSPEQAGEKEELIGILFEKIMTMPFDDLFSWREENGLAPARAKIHLTVPCAVCGEGVMQTRAVESAQGWLCPACREDKGGVASV